MTTKNPTDDGQTLETPLSGTRSPQADAARILSHAVTRVCDGWTEPKHARKILTHGDPLRISHGMCPDCERAMSQLADAEHRQYLGSIFDPRD